MEMEAGILMKNPLIGKEDIMNDFAEAARAGGKSMTFFGVIAIILGMLAMMMPGLTGVSVVYLLGVIVLGAGIVRMIWAFQAGSLGKGMLMFAIGLLTLLAGLSLLANPLPQARQFVLIY